MLIAFVNFRSQSARHSTNVTQVSQLSVVLLAASGPDYTITVLIIPLRADQGMVGRLNKPQMGPLGSPMLPVKQTASGERAPRATPVQPDIKPLLKVV